MRFLLVGLIALPLALPAVAQSDATSEVRLDPITVEARRIEEPLVNVPIGVSTIAPDAIVDFSASGDDITYLSARTPSLVAESSFGRTFPRVYIRGLGNIDFDLNASQPVSIVYDDVPYESPVLKGFPLFDLEGVEVLRGPQGTLFGRNTTAGTIRIDSVAPQLGQTGGFIRASYGSYDTTSLTGAVNLPVGEKVAVRLSGLRQSRADYIENAVTGRDEFGEYEEYAWRAQLFAQPTESFSLLANLHGRRLDGEQTLFRANIFDQGSNALNENFDRDRVFQDAISEQTLDQTGLTIRAAYDFGAYELTYVLGYETASLGTRGDGDGGAGANFLGNAQPGSIPFTSESGGFLDDLDQFSNELRLAYTGSEKLSWQVGAFRFDEAFDIRSLSYNTLAGGSEDGRADRSQELEAWAVYASADYAVTERLNLSGGVRYTDDSRDFTATRIQSPFGAPPIPPTTLTVADEQVSWDVAANYDFDGPFSAYARIARGFRAPSVQGRLVFGSDIWTTDSETVISAEAGVRYSSDRLSASATAFAYEISDQQLSAIGGETNAVRLLNAEKGVGHGVETEFTARPLAGLTLSGALSWTETEIDDPGLSVRPCGAPCTVLDPLDANGNAIIDGNPFPYAPEWNGFLAGEYVRALAGGEAFIRTDWAYTGERNFLLYESAEFRGEGFWEGGLRAGYRSATGWEASLFARNLLDEETALGGVDFNNLAGFTNQPRVVGVKLDWVWN